MLGIPAFVSLSVETDRLHDRSELRPEQQLRQATGGLSIPLLKHLVQELFRGGIFRRTVAMEGDWRPGWQPMIPA